MTYFLKDSGEQIIINEDVLFTKEVFSAPNFNIKGDFTVSFSVPNNSDTRKNLGIYTYKQVSPELTQTWGLYRDGNFVARGSLIVSRVFQKTTELFFISGNSNWISLLNFSCKQITNNGYQVKWTGFWIDATKSNTDGIIFPVVDYLYNREKYDNTLMSTLIFDGTIGTNSPATVLPCLYLHTLVSNSTRVSGVKISGTLLDNKIYKSLIITPESPDLFNDNGQITPINNGFNGADPASGNVLIRIEDIAPDLEFIQIIKWLCVSFGCVARYDEFSKTLSLDLLSKYKKEEAEDWSQYIKDYTIDHSLQYENNYINYKDSEGLNIITDKGDGSSSDVYTSIFPFVEDGLGTTSLKWATPYVPMYTLEDDEEYTYSAVTDSAGFASFTASNSLTTPLGSTSMVVRIEDDGGVYTGYHLITGVNTTSFGSRSPFVSNSTGKLYTQSVSKNSGPFVLICLPNIPVSSFTAFSTIEMSTNIAYTSVSSVAYAYFAKPHYSDYPLLNGNKIGLHYVDQGDIVDVPIVSDTFIKIIRRAPVEGSFLLPEAVFKNYNFDKFVYINTNNLTGYFIASKIENYKDSKTLVKVKLYSVD